MLRTIFSMHTCTGPVTVRASQVGDSSYNAAPNVDRTFAITVSGTVGGTVKGKVFNDLDRDKKLDTGESGIVDVVLRLTGNDKNTKSKS